jgi:3-hydroxyisobutyrate dehydrogenase-like beta-hydroxyacid dehydrogenase
MPKAPPFQRIAIIGFGEAGGILGNDFARQGIEVSVFDILLNSSRHRQEVLSKARRCGVKVASNLSECLDGADVVISAVTASSTLNVAKDAARLLKSKQIFLDLNSVSPKKKRMAAKYIESGAARYVEAAVMDAIPKHRLKVPILLGGQYAAEISEQLAYIGMQPLPLSDEIGVASAVKMCRSIIIKGLEALTIECMFAARQYGAEDTVLKSLTATFPGLGWEDRFADYLIGRVVTHGRRRGAEMREVAQTLIDVSIEPIMALAAAKRQLWLPMKITRNKISVGTSNTFLWRPLADAVLHGTHKSVSRKAK